MNTSIASTWLQRAAGLLLAAPLFALALSSPARAQDLTVFAAASLQNAFDEIGRLYQARTGRAVKFSYAASSALARQIEQGAPAAIFASADEQWMDYLAKRDMIVPGTRKSLLGNRLVLVMPAATATTVKLEPNFDFAALLGRDGRWVTGDPGGVPVGRYAQQAMTRLGVWDFAQTRLVRAENVRVALAFVERGEAAAGVVYETDAAVSPKVRIAGIFPADSHTPVTYPAGVVARNDSQAAREFLRFLEGPEAREVFRRSGFSVLAP